MRKRAPRQGAFQPVEKAQRKLGFFDRLGAAHCCVRLVLSSHLTLTQKAGIAPGLRIKIQFFTRFWSNRIKILAAWARMAVPAASMVPSS